MSRIIFLSILLLFPAVNCWRTKFDFYGTFQCDRPGPWCITLWFRELDLKFHDDYGMEPRSCSYASRRVIYHTANDYNGDGFADNYFEPEVTVAHNCTGGPDRTFRYRFPDVSIFKTYARLDYGFDLAK